MAPDFRSPRFLHDRIARTMRFYQPRAIAPRGGFHHWFRDGATVYDVLDFAMPAQHHAGKAAQR